MRPDLSRLGAQLFGGFVPEIDGGAFVLVAACGLVCNALILYLFRDVAHSSHGDGHGHEHGHSHGHGGDGNVTARAAVVHAMGASQSRKASGLLNSLRISSG